ncbi:MAG: hypothetical protein IKU99_00505 [Clostridia bacterium]|nr:hypothetical protein [Clostridia bacterium]
MIGVFLIATIVSMLRLIGYRSGVSERLALGIICVYVVLSPIKNLTVDSLDNLFDIPEIETEDGAGQMLEDALSTGIARSIADEFSLKIENISVNLFDFDKESMTAGRIEIILSGSAVTADYRLIEAFVNEMNIGECRVEISF